MAPGEFDLIARIRQRIAARPDVVLGIGDDAALLAPPSGQQLVVAMDTLNAGVHFPHDTAPSDIGWKALAVNLSDLAAMGAQPAWCTLSLSLPDATPAWVDAFLDGFLALAETHGVVLVGGDTTRGPLSICVTVHGFVEPGRALRRDAAVVGDELWVSGTLGDAAGALDILLRDPAPGASSKPVPGALRIRLDRPTPRVTLGCALAGHVHACIDISDGLLADLGHVARASGVGMEVMLGTLPTSDALAHAFDGDARMAFQATGGDDYELAFSAARDQRERIEAAAALLGVPVTRIGRVVEGTGVCAFDARGCPWRPARAGYSHFG